MEEQGFEPLDFIRFNYIILIVLQICEKEKLFLVS